MFQGLQYFIVIIIKLMKSLVDLNRDEKARFYHLKNNY